MLHQPHEAGRGVDADEDADHEAGGGHHAGGACDLAGHIARGVHHAQRAEVAGAEAHDNAAEHIDPVVLDEHRVDTARRVEVAHQEERNEQEPKHHRYPQTVGPGHLNVARDDVADHRAGVEDKKATHGREVCLGGLLGAEEAGIVGFDVGEDDGKDGQRDEEHHEDVEALLPAVLERHQVSTLAIDGVDQLDGRLRGACLRILLRSGVVLEKTLTKHKKR